MFDAAKLAQDSPPIGPGTPGALRQILFASISECGKVACEHCYLLMELLGDYDGARAIGLGATHVSCGLHGVQPQGHACSWMETVERIMAARRKTGEV